MHVSAPASSANLGPGFDCLGLALDLPFELLDGDELDAHGAPPDGFLAAEPTHPAAAAFVVAGGSADTGLWWRSPIPPGRGLGFSGAARVAGRGGVGLERPGPRRVPVTEAEVAAAGVDVIGSLDELPAVLGL